MIIEETIIFSSLSLPTLILVQTLIGLGNTVYFISQVSLRQSMTPFSLQGKVNATYRFFFLETLCL